MQHITQKMAQIRHYYLMKLLRNSHLFEMLIYIKLNIYDSF